MSDLINSVEGLSREETLEAAQNLALQITQHASSGEREEELPKPFIDKPSENTEDIEQLARLILLTGAANSEKAETVRSAIEFSDGRELIPDGTEIVVLATLGLFTLNLLTKRKSSEALTIKIKEDGDKTNFIIENQVSYRISPSLGQLLKSYFARY
jgi:hypothetical protein